MYTRIILILLIVFVTAVMANDADIHNDYRIQLNAGNIDVTPNPPIPLLEYDPALAEIAQAWTDNCVWKHSSNSYGENLYANSRSGNVQAAVKLWVESEVVDYNYSDNTCSGVCGHYTQVVSERSTKVGCGITKCDAISGLNWGGTFIACNYSPHGNLRGVRPYRAESGLIDQDDFDGTTAYLTGIKFGPNTYDANLIFADGKLNIENVWNSDQNVKNWFDGKQLYIPKILINNASYFVLLRYNDDSTFDITQFGETK